MDRHGAEADLVEMTERDTMRMAAVMAAHNRRELTLACLRSLRAQRVPGVLLDVFVLDDASSDGTGEAIAEQFPEATLLRGDGKLYWNGGMRRAFGEAIAGDYDYYLWMNDDTTLDDGALALLLETDRQVCERGSDAVIVAGAIRHPETGKLTYGGVVRRHRWQPLRWERVQPGEAPRQCETMNGNTVLVSRTVVRRVGNLDPAFTQQMGDFDYGLRARRAGCSVWTTPGTIGMCASHPRRRTDQQPLLSELRRLWSIKELSPRPWATFTRRWAGALWPLYWLSPYVRRGSALLLERTPARRLIGPSEAIARMEDTGRDSDVDVVLTGHQAPNLTTRTASGLRWSLLGTAALMIANLVYTATISRLLDPVAFGLMALANLAVLFTQYFARLGIASALVQKPDLSEDDVRAASTAGIVGGAACLALIWVLAPLVSAAFDQPPLTPMLQVLGIGFIFDGWSMTGSGLLLRELRFRERSIVNLGTYVLGFLVVGVGMALLGAGAWSLVAASVVATVAQAVWLYALVRFPVRPVLRWEPYRAVCGYGMRLSGTHVMDYVSSNLDTLAVGRYASTAALGQYSRAYYLGFQPIGYHLAQASTNVLFSGLSRIQEDLDRLRRAYIGVFALSGVLLFPICVGLAVAAPEVVLVVLGPQWPLAVTLLPWFAIASGFSVLSKLSRSMVEARAELNGSLVVQAVHLVALGTALLVLALTLRSWGIWIFAAAVAGGEALRHLGYLVLVRRILKLSAAQVGQMYGPAAIASAVVALAIAGLRTVAAGHMPVLGLLVAELVVGAAALVLCIRYCLPRVRGELRMRLTAAGVIGDDGGLRERLASVVVGPRGPAMQQEPRS